MSRFLSDFETGCGQGRYVSASLPNLPFPDSGFGLALWSVRVNGNWRMTFEFQDGNAYILDYEDLLARLDRAIADAVEEQIFVDEVNE